MRKSSVSLFTIFPKISFGEAEYLLRNNSFNGKEINNDEVYNAVKKLTARVFPAYKESEEERWEDFYLPLKRNSKLISIPFKIVEYKKEFFAIFHLLGNLHITKGSRKVEKTYRNVFEETLKFTRLIKKTNGEILKKAVPYDFRTGKIKGRYILEKVFSQKEKRKIMNDYKEHASKKFKGEACSLNEYLHIAGICYRPVYGKKARLLNPLEMYKKWADGRDGKMLSIKDGDSKKAFADWHKRGMWVGSHPFEIVFSWHRHGIHLHPPSSHNNWKYSLRVTNYAYAKDFIKMVKAAIKNNVPFSAYNLEEVLDYLAGETYFTVNCYSDNSFFYTLSREYRKEYFKHIEWDEFKILKWRS